MSATAFDSYLAVDWSAAGARVTGANSIWWALRRPDGAVSVGNPATRAEGVETVARLVAAERAADRRLLAGFDFPFGYPAGVAQRLAGAPGWRALWAKLAEVVEEGPSNANNRFAAAAALNRGWDADGPFWFNGERREHEGLTRKKPGGRGGALPPEWRIVEGRARAAGARPKTVWQLAGAGSVGGQALTGIAALERLRRDPRLAEAQVWPLETGLSRGDAPVVLAEIYPSLFPPAPEPGEPLDAAQVRGVVAHLAALDAEGALTALFAPGMSDAERAAVCAEEAWILGVGAEPRPASRPRWERDPAAIYAASFATVRAEAHLDRFAPEEAELAVRVIHACGMTDVAETLIVSPGAVAAGRRALDAGAPILCDCEAVASGVIRRALPRANAVVCMLSDPRTADVAAAEATTRSAAAVGLWGERLGGAVVAIGNAPTALFRLLELLDSGAPRPALILGYPVGFVGASESKAALAADPCGVPFVTLPGRCGGSAMAAAAVNALTVGLSGDGT